jgi:hypothetical protein
MAKMSAGQWDVPHFECQFPEQLMRANTLMAATKKPPQLFNSNIGFSCTDHLLYLF